MDLTRSIKNLGETKPTVNGVACDSLSFIEFAEETEQSRGKQCIDTHQFASMARDTNTIVLDARSEAAYELLRVVGSKNLPYISFSETSLQVIVPRKDTRSFEWWPNQVLQRTAAGNRSFHQRVPWPSLSFNR